MPRPYPISIQVDGRTCKADWLLLQGCKVYVRSAWGNDTVDADCDDNLQEVANRTLERIVRADDQKRAAEQKQRERAVARVNRYWDERSGRLD